MSFNPPDQWHEYFQQVFDDPWDRPPGDDYSQTNVPAAPAGHPFNGILPPHHEFDWGPLAKPEAEFGDVLAVDWASNYLRQSHEQPFFLAVGLFHPHLPWYAPRNPIKQPHSWQAPNRAKITAPNGRTQAVLLTWMDCCRSEQSQAERV